MLGPVILAACVIANEVSWYLFLLRNSISFEAGCTVSTNRRKFWGPVFGLIATVLLQRDFEVFFMFTARRYRSFSLYKTPNV